MNTKDIPENLARDLVIAIMYRESSHFDDAAIMNVISKIPRYGLNMDRFNRGFPEHMAIYEEWFSSTDKEKFFNKYLLKD